MKLKKIKENKILLYSLILTALVLLIIPVIRLFYYDNLLVGEQQYSHVRMSKYILENGIPSKDPFMDSPYLLDPLHLVLAGLFSFLPVSFVSFLLPFLLGILCIILFYYILKEIRIEKLNKFFALFILIISPIFIYTFSVLNSYSLAVFVLLLGFFFFIKNDKPFFFRKRSKRKNKMYFILSLIFFAIIPFFNFASVVFSIAFILIYSLNKKKKLKQFYNVLSVIITIALVRYIIYLIKYGIPYLRFNSSILVNYFSELGGILSFGIFQILLAVIGLFILWNKKKQILGYILLLTAIIFSFYFNSINIYINFVFAIAAGQAFLAIKDMHYSLDIIKKLTVALLLFGLLFSTISYTARISTFLPDSSVIDSLEWLKSNSKQGQVVFSHHSKGDWIQSIAERPVLFNSNLIYVEDAKIRISDANNIFYSRNLKNTVNLLEQYNISYIWIDSEMKRGLVWTEEDQGLLFLFSNKEKFRKIYDEEGIEIWKVKQ